ncbi:TPA: hypothetical protein U1C81_000634 [Streptococcus suis]|nr:hypothetical protein [Streptococcus suis]HEM3666902.1 hypothetical protein [Streptococcus suis]HEM3720878.1 hypothetical protein [Streptococcus suis]
MTNEEYVEATTNFFIRYSDHRGELARAEGKADVKTLVQSLVNAETTIANLLVVLNKIGIPYYNNNALPPNVKQLIKVLDMDGVYSEIFKPSNNPLDDE